MNDNRVSLDSTDIMTGDTATVHFRPDDRSDAESVTGTVIQKYGRDGTAGFMVELPTGTRLVARRNDGYDATLISFDTGATWGRPMFADLYSADH